MKYIPNISIPTIKVSGYLPQEVVDKFSRDEEAKNQRHEILERQKKNTFFHTIRETLKSIAGPITGAGLGLFVAGTLDAPEETADIIKDALKSATDDLNEAQEALDGVQEVHDKAAEAYRSADVSSAAEAKANYEITGDNLQEVKDNVKDAESAVSDAADQASEREAKLESSGNKKTAGLAMLGGSAVATTGALMANSIGAKYAHAASFDQSELNAQHNAKYIRQELEEMRAEQAQPVVVFNNPEAERGDGKSWVQAEDERQEARLNQQHQV